MTGPRFKVIPVAQLGGAELFAVIDTATGRQQGESYVWRDLAESQASTLTLAAHIRETTASA